MSGYSVVVLSKNADNLCNCLNSVFTCEPNLPRDRILVIDDGVDKSFRAAVKVNWIDGIQPFIFARNANLGLRLGGDMILMNDDSRLLTFGGFSRMVADRPNEYGIVSAAIRENVGNWGQKPAKTDAYRPIHGALAFICVLLPESTLQTVGLLDERYTAYGSDDNDYCRRAKDAGLAQAVADFCVVAHDGRSTFRTMANNIQMLEEGREIYRRKWGVRP